MKINFSNYQKGRLELFINDNIKLINTKINDFSGKKIQKLIGEKLFKEIGFTSTEIQIELSKRFCNIINNDIILAELKEKIEKVSAENKKDLEEKLTDIANDYFLYSKDIERFYKSLVLEKMRLQLNKTYIKKITDLIFKDFELTENEKLITYDDIKEMVNDYMILTFNGGFSQNIQFNEAGLKNANEGDSSQFLFVSRAILAGFNCSNVDLRSSKYDAVIDYNGEILRVQVKGRKSERDSIPLSGRPRGGEGNDTSANRNKPQFIREEDCDVYVSINKKTGICYIIPTYITEPYVQDAIKNGKKQVNFPKEEAKKYCENWNILFEIAKHKKNREK